VEAVTRVQQRVCGLCGGAGWVRLDVEMGDPRFGKAVMCECRRAEIARRRAEGLCSASGIPAEALRRWTFKSFEPEGCQVPAGAAKSRVVAGMRTVKAECMAYAREPKGWRVLMGAYGSGKTHLAYAIAGSCQARGVAAFAATAPDMLDMLRASYRSNEFAKRLDELRNVGLLVIDDLATEKGTPWVVEKLYQIVNHRYAANLPLIVTTNLNVREAPPQIDGRILSRLLEGTDRKDGRCRLWVLAAGDYRLGKRRGRSGGKG